MVVDQFAVACVRRSQQTSMGRERESTPETIQIKGLFFKAEIMSLAGL
jgi:hypothetical protein